jgi:hypothetical protein
MTTPNTFTRRDLVTLAGVALVVVIGCSDSSGLAKRYPVSGTINYNGKPVEKGTVTFTPTQSDGRTASGDITNGRYSLTTAAPGDGALPGSYKVTVTAKEMDTTELKAIAKGGQFHHDEAFAKAVKEAKPLVPVKYSLADTSGLTAEVKAQTNTIPLELKD